MSLRKKNRFSKRSNPGRSEPKHHQGNNTADPVGSLSDLREAAIRAIKYRLEVKKDGHLALRILAHLGRGQITPGPDFQTLVDMEAVRALQNQSAQARACGEDTTLLDLYLKSAGLTYNEKTGKAEPLKKDPKDNPA